MKEARQKMLAWVDAAQPLQMRSLALAADQLRSVIAAR